MFHASDNLFFGRLPDGRVRILKFKSPPPQWPTPDANYASHLLDLDYTAEPGVWASIVASVSAQGDGNNRFYTAQRFHMDAPAPHSSIFSRPECIFNYCPQPDSCRERCQSIKR